MESVKKSIDERAQHKREYDIRVNERQMQTTEGKVDTGKALDANIGPIYDEEPMDESQHKTYLPKERESDVSKPHHMIAPGSSRYSSNDMVHNHYLEEAKKKTQESSRNSEPSVMPSARSQSTTNDGGYDSVGPKRTLTLNNFGTHVWMSKKQDCTVMSSAKTEYMALSASCTKVMWMRTQLKDYGFNYNKIPLYYDSQSAIAISCNPVQHSRTKHFHTRYHFIKEQVSLSSQTNWYEIFDSSRTWRFWQMNLLDISSNIDL
ncbi:hypothetical protein Tco_0868496 [Tanacetum coccineum]